MKTIICLFLLFLMQNSVTKTFPSKENLHHFMDDGELNYYFGTDLKNSVPDYEVVDLPTPKIKRKSRGTTVYKLSDFMDDKSEKEMNLNFNFEDNPISLNLRPSSNLVSPYMKIVKRNDEDKAEILNFEMDKFCHFMHLDEVSTAAISNCQDDEINGIIFLPNSTLEIQPLNKRLKSLINLRESMEATSGSDNLEDYNFSPHIVKRSRFNYYEKFKDVDEFRNSFMKRSSRDVDSPITLLGDTMGEVQYSPEELQSKRSPMNKKLTIELGLFFDEAAYKIFSPYFNYHDKQLKNVLLAYMNGIQALYHHPSLGTSVDITIVYLEIMNKQPKEMPHYDGERNLLLDSFCAYQSVINPGNDEDPNHWDMGLYVSGLDFFAYDNGRRSGVTMGLATVGGVCLSEYACVIAEFGTTNIFGKPYPSAGFTSVYISAHEIGHNLGMHHDSTGNFCSKDGYVMSPSRGTQGETTWSACSANTIRDLNWAKCLFDAPAKVPEELDAEKYKGHPGQTWTAKKQCEILLIDKDAISAPTSGLESICQNLQCRTRNRSGFYFAGPALEGTECGNSKWCVGGACVKQIKKPTNVVPGGWSDWKYDKCSSGCITNSKGYQKRSRLCNKPVPVNTDEGCGGNAYDVVVCDDSKICSGKKESIVKYASKKCKEFSKLLPKLDSAGLGLQAPHESNRLWMSCAIFCKRSESGAYYTPRFDLNDLGVDSYFPDGTWCHSENSIEYFCIQRHCLPENFKTIKTSIWSLSEDVPLPGNVLPANEHLEKEISNYLSIDKNKKPFSTQWNTNDVNYFKDNDWSDIDYVELPEGINRYEGP